MENLKRTITANENYISKKLILRSEVSILKKIKKATYYTLKRTFDIICAIIGCAGLIPMLAIIKIVYLINKDYDPIIYTQNRIGKNGKEFKFYKIRTMIPNADEKLKEILENNKELAEEYRINKKLSQDPRVTPIGQLLRKTSLDEFPQFFNVLKGDMAIIGNRPYLPREKEDMEDYYDSIVSTKCGIFSYWAVNGRSDVTFKERLKIESCYSKNQSFKLDLKIFIKVILVVLLRKGAK